ncbi:hypothetical protein F4777DRAFT_19693 [Nemania sp. FL0916]|nr:hypothetical protein F4777DRAFT_19693 [Nemania sp. FL0916]
MADSPDPALSGSRVSAIYGTVIAELLLSVAFIALRLQARRLSFGYLRLDLSDWLAILALLCTTTFHIIVGVGTVFGLGRHAVADTDLRGLIVFLLLANAFHPLAVGLLKLSILSLYRSIFPSTRFHRAVTAVASFVVAWTLATFILGLTYCIPIESLWDPAISNAHCLPLNLIGLVTTSVHIVIEVLIFLMPIPSVLKLQTSTEKKRLIILSFVVGGVGCIVSIARVPIWAQAESSDLSWDQVPSGLLAATELTVGLLAISFPTYRPLFRGLGRVSGSARPIKFGDSPSAHHDIFSRCQHRVTVSAAQDRSALHNGIVVTDEIELMRHSNPGGNWMDVLDEEEPRS